MKQRFSKRGFPTLERSKRISRQVSKNPKLETLPRVSPGWFLTLSDFALKNRAESLPEGVCS